MLISINAGIELSTLEFYRDVRKESGFMICADRSTSYFREMTLLLMTPSNLFPVIHSSVCSPQAPEVQSQIPKTVRHFFTQISYAHILLLFNVY